MQAHSLLLTAPHKLAWITETLPALQPNEVLVQTIAGAISIGTELPHYLGISRQTHMPHYPYMTGYESIGKVVQRGANVRHLQLGEHVVAFYGHRTHTIVSATKAIPVPTAIPDALALLSILTCDVAKGIDKLSLQSNASVLITGAGTIGLLTIFMLRARNTTLTIDIIEPDQHRRDLAQYIYAHEIRGAYGPSAFMPEDREYAIGIECSSSNAAFALLQQHMQHNGRICILADGNKEPLVLTPDFHTKELTIVGSSDGIDYQSHARQFFALPLGHTHRLLALFEHSTTADNLIATFDDMANGIINPVKVIVHYKPPCQAK